MAKNSLALRAVPRDNLERMTMQLRRRARNEKLQIDRVVGRAVAVGGAITGAALMGTYVGTRMRDGKSTTMPGIGGDVEIWAGVTIALLGGYIQAKTKKNGIRIAGEFVQGSGDGMLAYWMGSKAESMAAQRKPAGALAA